MRSKPCLTASDVKTILAACEAEAEKSNLSLAVSVVDGGGHLIGFLRMDGASVMAVETGMAKARTSALSGMPTKMLQDMIEQRPAMGVGVNGLLPVQGGVPIRVQGECVGAVGAGGAPGEEDERVALVGVAALS